MPRILLVDDETNVRRILRALLEPDGHEVAEARSYGEAMLLLKRNIFDLVLTDQKLPDGLGIHLVERCREEEESLPVVLITAFATVELAVEAMKKGAFDFITKPFQPDQVRAVVRRATERVELLRENERLRSEVGALKGRHEILGNSRAIRDVRELISRVGSTPATVLISGETGTGKELVARAIHAVSPRASRPFLAVNCAGFTETLLESELFGHERGSFTGADRTRPGVFEAAHRGTLFLDEAGEMPLSLQAKLLRVLVDGEVTRVGSTVPRTVDVRILAATNRDLKEQIAAGTFREDLYYRLAVFPIEVPPLRAHLDDLPLLAEAFALEAARRMGAPARRLSAAALARLQRYAFPGNVRELRNLIERAVILARGDELEAADFPVAIDSPPDVDRLLRTIVELPPVLDLRAGLQQVERTLILRALADANGVQAEAARRLGISRSDIGYKMRRLGIETPGGEG